MQNYSLVKNYRFVSKKSTQNEFSCIYDIGDWVTAEIVYEFDDKNTTVLYVIDGKGIDIDTLQEVLKDFNERLISDIKKRLKT